MDLLSGIASASIGFSSSRLMTDVSVAMMGKTLDTAREQGQALQQMVESAAPDAGRHLLDVYA